MFGIGRNGNQKIVDVGIQEVMATQNFVNEALENVSGIPKAERHA